MDARWRGIQVLVAALMLTTGGEVPLGRRVYFQVPVTDKASKYRVTVLSFDVFQRRG